MYTLEDAKKILLAEFLQKLKKKVIGVLILAFIFSIPFFMEGDATASIVLLPIGLAYLIGKDMDGYS